MPGCFCFDISFPFTYDWIEKIKRAGTVFHFLYCICSELLDSCMVGMNPLT